MVGLWGEVDVGNNLVGGCRGGFLVEVGCGLMCVCYRCVVWFWMDVVVERLGGCCELGC